MNHNIIFIFLLQSGVDMQFLKCGGNSIPQSFNTGPLGDHLPNMWNAPVKGQMSEPSDKGVRGHPNVSSKA